MPIPIFDTLKYANALKAADVPDKQAEAQANLLGEALTINFKELVTKDDLKQMEERINVKFDGIRWTMNILLSMVFAVLALVIRTLFVKP